MVHPLADTSCRQELKVLQDCTTSILPASEQRPPWLLLGALLLAGKDSTLRGTAASPTAIEQTAGATLCGYCCDDAAALRCDECEMALCLECSSVLHLPAGMRGHSIEPLEACQAEDESCRSAQGQRRSARRRQHSHC